MEHFVPDYSNIEDTRLLVGWVASKDLRRQVNSRILLSLVNWIAQPNLYLVRSLRGVTHDVDIVWRVEHVSSTVGLLLKLLCNFDDQGSSNIFMHPALTHQLPQTNISLD